MLMTLNPPVPRSEYVVRNARSCDDLGFADPTRQSQELLREAVASEPMTLVLTAYRLLEHLPERRAAFRVFEDIMCAPQPTLNVSTTASRPPPLGTRERSSLSAVGYNAGCLSVTWSNRCSHGYPS